MCKKIRNANIPSKVMDEMNISSKILRDLFDENFKSILVNDETLQIQLKDYIQEIAPKKESIVKLYNSGIPIFEKFGIERQIKTSFGKNVSMTKGSYLVIEHTEALHVIDVNSGNRSSSKNQEESALEVNLIAATEIARQLRLRDMGGIIVVDFIDQNKVDNRKKLFNHLKSEMKEDRAKHKILPPSKFGLIQITRQRVRPEMNIKTREENPSKNESNDEVEAPIVLIDKISEEIERLINKGENNINLNLHPFIAAYLEKGYPSVRLKWYFKHKQWIKIVPRDAYKYLEYRFLDENGKSI